MHALLVELFPWLVALYVADGLAQLGRGHLLLVAGAAGRFRLLRAGLHLSLSPLAEEVAAHDLPFLAAGERVYVFDPARRSDPALIADGDLAPLPRGALAPVTREGRRVLAAGQVAVTAPGAEWAEAIRARLEALAAGAGAPGVAGAAGQVEAVRALRARGRPWRAALRVVATLLAAALFVAWPALAYAPGALPLSPAALLAATGVLVLASAALTFAMLVACGERAGRSAAAALHLVAFPVAAARPLAHGPRALYRRFDALAIAAALLPRGDFAALAARELRRARLSRVATDAALAPAWDARARELAVLLEAVGVPEAEALAPPARAGDAARWCPLCEAQYRAGFESCASCGVAAEPFAGA